MEESLPLFQRMKEKLEADWDVVTLKDHQIHMYNWGQTEVELSVTYLENETNSMRGILSEVNQLIVVSYVHPHIEEVRCELQLRKNWFCFSFEISEYFKEIKAIFWITMEARKKGTPRSLSAMGEQDKKELRQVYDRLKDLVCSLPKYRLYYVTESYSFNETQINKWI